MSLAELILHRSDDGATLTFSFLEGERPAVVVAVVDEETDQRVWVLKSDALAGALPGNVATAESAEEEAPEKELLARGAGWPDTMASRTVRKVNRPLRSFEYGKVPPGFRQVLPVGTPPPLQRGRRYSVIVVGGVGIPVGLLSFEA